MNYQDRAASYNVAATLTRGTVVALTEDAYYSRQWVAGDRFEVLSITNAGFRGMEMFGKSTETGQFVTFSAGIVKVVK